MATQTSGSSLLLTIAIDGGIQFAFYLISAAFKTEVVYDLSGALTYIVCILVALLYRPDPLVFLSFRQIIASIGVLIWSSRLGFTLFLRVLRVGEDKRFEKLKGNPLLFLVPWFFQP